ncbi:PilN domain-containing protein [Methylopila sp. 73B]|uniref:PilN domain-containing protein n=1 Tax=Methylopila sp. 73B TaxID=1120792 RepID=UPI000381F118|nr:PilN domain-containing protein [Methylopila sp. 73B]
MALKETLAQATEAIVDVVAPLAARFARGPRRVAVAEDGALALYDAPIGAPAKHLAPKDGAARGPVQGELRLPAGAVLTRTLSFPAATRDYLDAVIENRLERLTPWAPERVLYGYRASDAADGSLDVRFVAASREVADSWIAKAAAIGFTPTALGGAGEPLDAPLSVDLWRGGRDPFRRRVRRGLAIAAVAVVGALVPLAAGSYWALHRAEERLADLERRSQAARRTLMQASGGGAREHDLMAEKRPETAVVTLVDKLAAALPDGTALRDLEIDPERVRLAGVSNAAPELIGLLTASGALPEARFSAPVTRNADGRDGFEIVGRRPAGPKVQP